MKSWEERNAWLTTIMHRSLDGFATLSSAANIRISEAEQDVYKQAVSSPVLAEILQRILIKDGGKEIVGDDIAVIARGMAARTVANGEQVLAAACIVLAHSLLDDIVTDGCLLAIECDPQSWIPELSPDHTVTIRELRDKGQAAILEEGLRNLGGQLRGKSLPRRADVFFRRVPIVHHKDALKTEPGYFRMSTLEELDELRHGIVHRFELNRIDVSQTKNNVWFFKEAADTIVRSLSRAYTIGPDKDLMMKLFKLPLAEQGKPKNS